MNPWAWTGRNPYYANVFRSHDAEEPNTPHTRLAAELLTHRPMPENADLTDPLELLRLAQELDTAGEPATPSPDQAETQLHLRYDRLPWILPSSLGPGLDTLRSTDGKAE
ncbi:hypothetical protein [Nocardia sp. XZ_19_385]|uniref:hypothetical protein n=1 Tax=Nocardia sp. XZ_19_385 TaxID=2769488 RepID=UPI00188F1D7C|nr:hypothetical protein [Nocardia sp. XZ_19_385]